MNDNLTFETLDCDLKVQERGEREIEYSSFEDEFFSLDSHLNITQVPKRRSRR